MSTKTLGTNATTTLTALQFGIGSPQSDTASLATLIKTQPGFVNAAASGNTYQTILGGAWDNTGLLYLPGNRGVIQLQVGDWVGVDSNGWPIVVSGYSISQANQWTHT